MAKSRRFQVTLTGTLPAGMTLAQARFAIWNQNLDLDIDVDGIGGRNRIRPMKMRLGRATLRKA